MFAQPRITATLFLTRPELIHFWRDESAQDMIEYALVAACVGLSTVAGVQGLAVHISGYLTIVLNAFSVASTSHM